MHMDLCITDAFIEKNVSANSLACSVLCLGHWAGGKKTLPSWSLQWNRQQTLNRRVWWALHGRGSQNHWQQGANISCSMFGVRAPRIFMWFSLSSMESRDLYTQVSCPPSYPLSLNSTLGNSLFWLMSWCFCFLLIISVLANFPATDFRFSSFSQSLETLKIVLLLHKLLSTYPGYHSMPFHEYFVVFVQIKKKNQPLLLPSYKMNLKFKSPNITTDFLDEQSIV